MKTIKATFCLWAVLGCVACSPSHETMQKGVYEPTWESLSQYGEAPEWFQDAKFGIWAHWGPQCQPEQGDWYARNMYNEGSRQYKWHVEHYGHPSESGFKEVIHSWKGDKWNPDSLLALYKKAGAKYFFAMGNHHDNFDLWDSKYQPWNSVNMGPRKDILAGWEKAARANGLRFGVSIHAAHAWTWMETAQRSDKQGEKAGVPYDGKLTKEDGKGTWWEGYDPQELYAQNHPLSEGSEDIHRIHSQWAWENGAALPTEAYCRNFFDRTVDMINKYRPDMVYYDDTSAPLWPASDYGLQTVAHLYNKSLKEHDGKNEAVVFAKILTEQQKECLVWDVEKGVPDRMQEKPWQTCTCLGNWHYDRHKYETNGYKSAAMVVGMLVDIISKNGNLLLSVPMRGDGSIDEKEKAILEGIASWMEVNGEGVYGTRPWHIFGEGPVAEDQNPLKGQGFNEGKHQAYTAEDIRFVTKEGVIYAHVMAWPENGEVIVKSLSAGNHWDDGIVSCVELLGHGSPLEYSQQGDGLVVHLPEEKTNPISLTLKISTTK